MSQRPLRLSSVLYILLFLFYFLAVISTILSSSSLICSFASDILLLIPSRVFLISITVLFVSVCLFFNLSRSLLIDYCIFSILFLKFGIIYTIIGKGNSTPLQYSCLENPMDGGTWWATVHGVAKSQTQLSDFTLTFHSHTLEKEMATHSSVLALRVPGTGEPGGLQSMGSHRVGHN